MIRAVFYYEQEDGDEVEVEVEGSVYPGEAPSMYSPGEPPCVEVEEVRIDGVDLATLPADEQAAWFAVHEDAAVQAIAEADEDDRDEAMIAAYEDRDYSDRY